MKHSILTLLVFVLFSCDKKEKEIDPDLAFQIKGNYAVYEVSDGVKTVAFPFQGITMGIRLEPVVDKMTIAAIITIGYPDGTSGDPEHTILTLKKSGSNTEMYENDTKIGFVSGDLLEINQVDNKGARTIVRARK